jgi:hypothetical protein
MPGPANGGTIRRQRQHPDMRASEHILLESPEAREVPDLRTARKVHARLALRSRLRRHVLELALIDLCYLAVRTQRWRRPQMRYVLDLRFVDPTPRHARHVPWRWIAASVLIGALAVLAARYISLSPIRWWQNPALPACLALYALALGATVVSLYRTTETVSLHSVNGHAQLLEYTGGVGTFRALRTFHRLLKAHLHHAVAARRRALAEHLRDEMREHSRLRALGVLSEGDYETSKRRILATHGVVTRPGPTPARASPLVHRPRATATVSR